ncbi:MAG: hypothetical protein PVSMB8_10010 [Vulcanimicrobiaceae bacterium]
MLHVLRRVRAPTTERRNIARADGTSLTGFTCEPFALVGARDITAFGGWRAYATQHVEHSSTQR